MGIKPAPMKKQKVGEEEASDDESSVTSIRPDTSDHTGEWAWSTARKLELEVRAKKITEEEAQMKFLEAMSYSFDWYFPREILREYKDKEDKYDVKVTFLESLNKKKDNTTTTSSTLGKRRKSEVEDADEEASLGHPDVYDAGTRCFFDDARHIEAVKRNVACNLQLRYNEWKAQTPEEQAKMPKLLWVLASMHKRIMTDIDHNRMTVADYNKYGKWNYKGPPRPTVKFLDEAAKAAKDVENASTDEEDDKKSVDNGDYVVFKNDGEFQAAKENIACNLQLVYNDHKNNRDLSPETKEKLCYEVEQRFFDILEMMYQDKLSHDILQELGKWRKNKTRPTITFFGKDD
jgi:hypothetical protein